MDFTEWNPTLEVFMFRRSWLAERLVEAGLLGGLWLTGSSAAVAQQPLQSSLTDLQATPLAQKSAGQPATKGEPIPAPKDPTAPGMPAEAADPAKTEECKPFWTTVPNLSPRPRTGNFLIPPSSPGYYSLQDYLTDNYRDKPPKYPWGAPISPCFFPFYDNDFRYLDDPKNTQHDWLDPIKRIHIGDDLLLSIGGEERVRYMYEISSRLTGKFNDYTLLRSRVYGDLWYKDCFRVYVEFLDAQSFGQDLAPLAIDIDRSDLLNAFVELKVGELRDSPIYIRVGRQEMYYGSQRLISPLDWANTRRTFEGIKGYWHSEDLDVEAFYVKPVQVFQNRFDAADANRQFAGFTTEYRPNKSQAIDLYYLFLDTDLPLRPKLPPAGRGGQNVNTIGGRYVGDMDKKLLWDFEGAYQFGDRVNDSISAGMATAGLGYHCCDTPLDPTFWIYYDFASGSEHGVFQGGTFNQLFPFGHFYFGFIDVVGRQNIQDLNLHAYIWPTKWITSGLQAHFFYLDSGRDALYSAGGAVERTSPKGNAGVFVGDELDFTTNFHLSFHQDILVGYSVLFPGEFIRKTGSPTEAQLFYVQYSYKW
jgi:hypothetical protein